MKSTKTVPRFVKNAICFISVSYRPRGLGMACMAIATITGTQIVKLRMSGDVKIPAPGPAAGEGDAAAIPARIIETPPEKQGQQRAQATPPGEPPTAPP